MEITNISAIIWVIAAINVALGIFVYSMSKTRSSRAFLFAVISVVIWDIVIAFYISVNTAASATLLVKIAYFIGLIISVMFGLFFYIYPHNQKNLYAVKSAMLATTLIFGYLVFGTDTTIGQAFYIGGITHWGWHFGMLWYVFYILFFSWYISGLLVILYKGLHTPDKNVRNGTLAIFWGVIVLITIPMIVNLIMPQFGMFSLLWLGPILNCGWVVFVAYAIIKYEAMDVQLIAKRAFIYAVVVSGITLITISVNFLNSYFTSFYADFPTWFLYLISALIISALGYFIWLKLRESDLLKYEFVTTATHKFRTPLTRIKWATDNLEKTQTPEERLNQLEYIKSANAKLVELTNLLVNVSEADSSGYEYHLERNDISTVIEKTLNDLSNQFSVKHQQLTKNIEPGLYILGDASRIGFIVQTLVENAIHYTGEGGTITVSVSKKDLNVVCSVKDSGIGIPKEELPHLFSKFYRGSRARLADTEGMGIGLYIAKGIITRHKGKMWAESDGADKGSTFSFSLPVVA